jgi:hypothetical protein
MKAMIPLRVAGIVSNVACMAYALGEHLCPVFILHAILPPLARSSFARAIPRPSCTSGCAARSTWRTSGRRQRARPSRVVPLPRERRRTTARGAVRGLRHRGLR